MRLVNRDLEVIKAIYSYGCMTTLQIAMLFTWHIKMVQKRLRKLVRADYLRKLPLPTITSGRSPNLFYLGVQAGLLFDVPVSKPRLTRGMTHQIANASLMIQIILDFKDSGINCEVLPEHLIRTEYPGSDIFQDGAFMLEKDGQSALFMFENCSGTEIIKSKKYNEDIEIKLLRYVDIYENDEIGFFEEYFQKTYSRFRLLYLTNNSQRLSSISRVAREHDTHGFIWLATIYDFKNGMTSPIWQVPALNLFNQSIVE